MFACAYSLQTELLAVLFVSLDLLAFDWVDLVVRRHETSELLVQIKSLNPICSYKISLAQIKWLLLRDKHVIIGLHCVGFWCGTDLSRLLLGRYLTCDCVLAHMYLLLELDR